ncbi:MAG: FecR family protein [Gemmatimonadota bacterium]
MSHDPEPGEPLDAAVRRLQQDAEADVDVESALKRVKGRFRDAQIHELRLPERSAPRWRRTLIAMAAAIVALIGAPLLWQALQDGYSDATQATVAQVYETGVGETDSLRLSDGTRVVLAPNSRLSVAEEYGVRARLVELTGEALFDVTHDDAKPFSVRAGAATIRDLGTTFTVRNIGDADIEVAVTAGSVVLHDRTRQESEGVVLRAGDLGVLNRGGLAMLFLAGVTDADTAFVHGRLVFRETSMVEVAAELERWYGVMLRIEDPTVASHHITASFKGEPIREVLNVIGLALGARIELNGDTAIVRAQR